MSGTHTHTLTHHNTQHAPAPPGSLTFLLLQPCAAAFTSATAAAAAGALCGTVGMSTQFLSKWFHMWRLLLVTSSALTACMCVLSCVVCAGAHYGEVFERVALLQERPPIPPAMPEDYAALMVACWGPDPLGRPTFNHIQQALADVLKQLPDGADRFVADL